MPPLFQSYLSEESLIQFMNDLMQYAIDSKASDIHIEPYADICRIRLRIDGILQEINQFPLSLLDRLILRLKVIAKLDITEKRIPQDGRILLFEHAIRINTCPMLHGEKIVLRILGLAPNLLSLDQLGMSPPQLELFTHMISKKQGLILITGPTGSGKTITLYSALNYLNQGDKNISTVEDPVEMQLKGINQINIQPKLGLNFPNSLRALLRQDPDIIMIGEIRDNETAKIAVEAAHTGHLVFSTLHANDTLDAITRLHSLNVNSYYTITALSLVIAQRLIRKLCPHCQKQEIKSNYFIPHANGCVHCFLGYQGRTGIYECLFFTDSLRAMLLKNESRDSILKTIYNTGFRNLQQTAQEKLTLGITSQHEVNQLFF